MADDAWNAAWDVWFVRHADGASYGLLPTKQELTFVITHDADTKFIRSGNEVKMVIDDGHNSAVVATLSTWSEKLKEYDEPALQNPRQEITNIAEIVTREFTRLYRKRNMVVHGGQIHGANLHSISETLTPLIGAGIDRIVHAELQFGVPPIELSAIAEVRVDYLSPTASDSGGGLLDLLEHPVRQTTHQPQLPDIQPASSTQRSPGEADAASAVKQPNDSLRAFDTPDPCLTALD